MIPEALHKQVEHICKTLPGWQEAARSLAHVGLILAEQPKCVVEIGVYGGRSLIPQALALKHNAGKHIDYPASPYDGPPVTGKIYGIDPWHRETAIHGVTDGQKPDWATKDFDAIHNGFMRAVAEYEVESYVVPIRAKSQDARNLFGFGEIDILHIDGSHEEHDAAQDVKAYLPLMKRGGYIWFDDTDFKSTQKAVRILDDRAELQQDHRYFRLYRV